MGPLGLPSPWRVSWISIRMYAKESEKRIVPTAESWAQASEAGEPQAEPRMGLLPNLEAERPKAAAE
jgi:hypothetical protein